MNATKLLEKELEVSYWERFHQVPTKAMLRRLMEAYETRTKLEV